MSILSSAHICAYFFGTLGAHVYALNCTRIIGCVRIRVILYKGRNMPMLSRYIFMKHFRAYIYDANGSHLIGGENVYNFIVVMCDLIAGGKMNIEIDKVI